jgi:hypothetical protein
VLATAGSTLALIHAASPDVVAAAGWTIAFFVAAQVAAVATALALVQALVLRRATMSAADLRLLARRDALAIAAAGLTMFAAGAAVPGRGSTALLLAGPIVLCVALAVVVRARSLAARIDGAGPPPVRSPLSDLRQVVRVPVPELGPGELLVLTTVVAATGAFLRDRAEHATIAGAFLTAGVEAIAVVACFVVLGRPLGLWGRRTAETPRGQRVF